MVKSLFILVALDLSLILVQTSSAKSTPPDEKSSPNLDPSPQLDSKSTPSLESDGNPSPDSNSNNVIEPSPNLDLDTESDPSADDDDSIQGYGKTPAMTCALFGATGCNAECRLRALLYGSLGQGTCTENQSCQCHSKLVSFYQHWMKRFNATYTYRAILGDNNLLYEKVMEIFRNPLRTGKQYKELLKPLLSPYEYSKLKIVDNTLAAKFTGEGEPDKKAIQKYIDEKLELLLKPSIEPLLTTNYEENFKQILKNTDNKSTLYNISAKLDRLQNKTLNSIFEEYLKERKIEKPKVKVQKKQYLDEVFEDVFVNFIIQKNNRRNDLAKNSPSVKKPTQQQRNAAKRKASEESSPVKKATQSEAFEESSPATEPALGAHSDKKRKALKTPTPAKKSPQDKRPSS